MIRIISLFFIHTVFATAPLSVDQPDSPPSTDSATPSTDHKDNRPETSIYVPADMWALIIAKIGNLSDAVRLGPVCTGSSRALNFSKTKIRIAEHLQSNPRAYVKGTDYNTAHQVNLNFTKKSDVNDFLSDKNNQKIKNLKINISFPSFKEKKDPLLSGLINFKEPGFNSQMQHEAA